jgi:NAD-dependent DNA ligase
MKKYSSDFANPRNLVAGLLNSKDAGGSLKDCNYIKYGAIPFSKIKKISAFSNLRSIFTTNALHVFSVSFSLAFERNSYFHRFSKKAKLSQPELPMK